MIKRIKLPAWFVIVLLLAGITFGINQVVAKVLEESSESNVPKEKVVSSSVYPGLNIKTKTKETDLYTLSVSQPYTEFNKVNKPIDEWVDKQKKEFTLGIKKSQNMLEKNGIRAHLNIQAETEKLADKIYTLELQAYQITGGANGMTKMKSFVIDLNQKKLLHLDDVFQLDEKAIKDIQNLITAELHSNQKISSYISDDLVKKALNTPEKWKWSVSPKNVTFYFDEYEIAAGAAGAIKVEIPMKKVKPYLNEKFAKKIDVKIPEKENSKEEEEHSEDKVKLDTDGKYVALTFDDGPHPEVTPRILDTLKKHDAKATFFMLGSQVEYYPSLANKVEEAGHEIGNHTMNHQDLTLLQPSKIREEVQKSNRIIENATGQTSTLLRPPYGASNGNVKQVAKHMETPMAMWSVDSLDWKSRNATAVNEEVMSNVAPGSIVLLHDIHPSTADALPQLLTSLEKQGYQMVTVSQLLELREKKGVGPYYGKIG
ncbi:polysaccharide deacetylase family protein [Halobacillus shinanisalinarum]|uniref:Polysaccharide deacetylase family protein n=1 Tax=Halobacillus shinanisalinarum TaxID=2932258 RepID=A0ABY4GVH5_9BACI|nr:polysaccharide deacetylase family protein [Halobacillus shinanisalinarum]UOQ92034.1 polysaccharide deacetylase family protein [Halobacillus shinanisalinarum]